MTYARPARAAFALVGAGATVGVLVFAVLRLLPARSFADPRALALLEANDARLRTLSSASGTVEIRGAAGYRQTVTFRLKRPAFADVRASWVEKKPNGGPWVATSGFSETHLDGKNIWRVRAPPNGKPFYLRSSASSPSAPIADLEATLFANLLPGIKAIKPTFHRQVTQPLPPSTFRYVRYKGVQTWRGATYEIVHIREVAYEAGPTWADAMHGLRPFGEWVRARMLPPVLAGETEAELFIGADHLVHKQAEKLLSYYHGVPHYGGEGVTELRSVRINPHLSPADFRYAPPPGILPPPSAPLLPPGSASGPPPTGP